MKKAQYKRVKGKSCDIQWRYRDKQWICISRKWIRWAKKYLNRDTRRRDKQEVKNLEI